MRALVVEDNPVNQRIAVALLNRLGFYTDAVTSVSADKPPYFHPALAA
jgi:CheY-like chemotaxis protein